MVFINLPFFSSSDDSAKQVKIQIQTCLLPTALLIGQRHRYRCGKLATVATFFFFRSSKLCCTGAEMDSATRYMLRRNTASRDGQYRDTCIGDTYHVILLYRYRLSALLQYRVSVSIKHVFVHRRYKYLDTVFEHDESYQVLTACSTVHLRFLKNEKRS